MEEKWDIIIKPNQNRFDMQELLRYKDLIYMFVKRNFTAQYKQTILGPLWFIINPLLTTFISTIVFGSIAGIQTDGVPYFIFHLCGYVVWNYFQTCVSQTAATFTGNVAIMGKVYFPRITMPISTVLFALINTMIIFIMTLITIVVYAILGVKFNFNIYIILIPVLIAQTAALGLGVGVMISSLTVKYRDLAILVSFGLQLWMYITPVVYPLSQLNDTFRKIIMINPMAAVVNNFRYALLGIGSFEWGYWGISWLLTIIIVIMGIKLFGKVEKTFMDTV